MKSITMRVGWALVILGAALVFLLAWRYAVADLDAEAQTNTLLRDLFLNRRVGLYIHAFAMSIPLIVGPVQFYLRRLPPGRRERYTFLHRRLGRAYVVFGLLGGATGLYLALFAFGGFITALGFGILAVLTLWSTWLAFRRILAGDEASHKDWMTRSYALMFAAVTLRIYLGGFIAGGLDEMTAYRLVAWLSWAPNLAFAEMVIRRRHAAEAMAS